MKMNKISDKQLKTNCVNYKRYLKNIRGFYDDFFLYASDDFLFNLFYMMIHKKFVRWFGIDYHRITGIIRLFQDIYSKDLEKSIHELFGCIDDEDEIESRIKRYSWKITPKEDNLIITINEDIDYFNPNKEPDKTEYILPKYILHNFLQFKQLFYDVVSKKCDVGADTDFWLYACRYLLMGDKEFICRYGPNGRNFPYKLIEEYNPKGLTAILKEKEQVK